MALWSMSYKIIYNKNSKIKGEKKGKIGKEEEKERKARVRDSRVPSNLIT